MSSQRILLSILTLSILPLVAANAVADSPDSGFSYNDTKSDSDDSNDRDYLPGEEVTTESGRKTRVWSTRGPVPVNQQPPAAPGLNSGGQQLPAGVIVDDRFGVRGGVVPQVEPVEVPRVPRR